MRQEQKPGKLSDWERVDSAGFRKLSSPLSELARSVYIAGRSDTDSAITNQIQTINHTISPTVIYMCEIGNRTGSDR